MNIPAIKVYYDPRSLGVPLFSSPYSSSSSVQTSKFVRAFKQFLEASDYAIHALSDDEVDVKPPSSFRRSHRRHEESVS